METIIIDANKEIAGKGGPTGDYDWDVINLYPNNNYFESSVLPSNVELVGKYETGYKLKDPLTKSTKMVNLIGDKEIPVSKLRIHGHVRSHKIKFKYRITATEETPFPLGLICEVECSEGDIRKTEILNTDRPYDEWRTFSYDFSDPEVFFGYNVVFRIRITTVNCAYTLSVSDIEIDWFPPMEAWQDKTLLKANPAYAYADLALKDGKQTKVARLAYQNTEIPPDYQPPVWIDVTSPFYWSSQDCNWRYGEGGPPQLPTLWDEAYGHYDMSYAEGYPREFVVFIPNVLYWSWWRDVNKIRMTIEYDPIRKQIWDSDNGTSVDVTYTVEALSDYSENTTWWPYPDDGDPQSTILPGIFTEDGVDFTFDNYASPENTGSSPTSIYEFEWGQNEIYTSQLLALSARVTSVSENGTDGRYDGQLEGWVYPQQLFNGEFRIKKIEVQATPNPMLSDWIDISDANLWDTSVEMVGTNMNGTSNEFPLSWGNGQNASFKAYPFSTNYWMWQIDTSQGEVIPTTGLSKLKMTFDMTMPNANKMYSIFNAELFPECNFQIPSGEWGGSPQYANGDGTYTRTDDIFSKVVTLHAVGAGYGGTGYGSVTDIFYELTPGRVEVLPTLNSPRYNLTTPEPIIITDTSTLTAVALDDRGVYSPVISKTFVVNPTDDNSVLISDQFVQEMAYDYGHLQEGFPAYAKMWAMGNPFYYWNVTSYLWILALRDITWQRLRVVVYTGATEKVTVKIPGMTDQVKLGNVPTFKVFTFGPGQILEGQRFTVEAKNYDSGNSWPNPPYGTVLRIDILE